VVPLYWIRMVGLFVAIGRMKSKFKVCQLFRVKVVTKENPMVSQCNRTPPYTRVSNLHAYVICWFVCPAVHSSKMSVCSYSTLFGSIYSSIIRNNNLGIANGSAHRHTHNTHTHRSLAKLAHAPHRPIKIETVETYYSPALQKAFPSLRFLFE
jgi:hypothetical protein